MPKSPSLLDLHLRLSKFFGPLGWWPAETPFEVCVGAILTQNTSWKNVERAIANLKRECVLTPHCLDVMPIEHLAELIRPSGYFNEKAKKLKSFAAFLMNEFGGRIEAMHAIDTDALRHRLLELPGLGPETVDSILLYALERPVFVIDAYTKRVFGRHGFFEEKITYPKAQEFFEAALPADARLFNEYHAEIVHLAKDFCLKSKPLCGHCPVPCAFGRATIAETKTAKADKPARRSATAA